MASKASAAPSANGKAAFSTVAAQATANARLDQRAFTPHCRRTTTAKASDAAEIVATARSRMPSQAASG